jgi:aldose 1-epimerase
MQNTPDTELTLTGGDWQAVVSPYGASLRGLSKGGIPVVTGYIGAKNKVGGQGDVLIPFPGRVANGRYVFEGQTLQMDINDSEGPNAIHGFVRKQLWEIEQSSEREAVFTTEIHESENPGYPFALNVRIAYQVSADGLTVEFRLKNTGRTPAPVAAGFHPYFTVGSAWINPDTLHVPFEATLEYVNLIPTGRLLPVEETAFDFREPRAIDTTVLNTCFVQPKRDPDGRLRIRLSESETQKSVTVWMDAAFDYVVLYSGDPMPEAHSRRALAIEPMTCGSDAFNHPDWGLVTLVSDETLSGSWGVTAE